MLDKVECGTFEIPESKFLWLFVGFYFIDELSLLFRRDLDD
jgi:hypothetical protein